MSSMPGGYVNYTEWKREDPTSYWAFVNAKYERIQDGKDDSRFDIDEEFAEKVYAFSPKTSWDKFISRNLCEKETLWDVQCYKISDVGSSHPLYEVFERFVEDQLTKEDQCKIERINKGKQPVIWYARLWKRLKSFICFWKK